MDFEDSFASAPVRYALDDIDSDEELEACENNKRISIQAKVSLDLASLEDKITLVFGLDGPGNVYINSIEEVTPVVVGVVTRTVSKGQGINGRRHFNQHVY